MNRPYIFIAPICFLSLLLSFTMVWSLLTPKTNTTNNMKVQHYQDNKTITAVIYDKNIHPDTVTASLNEEYGNRRLELSYGTDAGLQSEVFDLYTGCASLDNISATPQRIEILLTKKVPEQWPFFRMGSCCPAPPPPAGPCPFSYEEADAEPEVPPATAEALFRQIYANASPDARRAMEKSFRESGGTVLSTNWEEVSQKTVEPVK